MDTKKNLEIVDARAVLNVTAKLVAEAASSPAIAENEAAKAKIDNAYFLIMEVARELDIAQDAMLAGELKKIEDHAKSIVTDIEEEVDGE